MASRHPCLSLAPAPRITFPRHPGCGAGGSSPKSEGRLDPARDIKCESFDIPPRFDPERPGLAPPRVSNLFRKQMFTFHQQFQRIPGKFVDLKVFTTVAWLSASRYRFPTSDPDDRKNSWLERLRCTNSSPSCRSRGAPVALTRSRDENFPANRPRCQEFRHRKASATEQFPGDRLSGQNRRLLGISSPQGLSDRTIYGRPSSPSPAGIDGWGNADSVARDFGSKNRR